MRSSFLPFSPISLDGEEERAVTEVLRSGWITTGATASRLEAEFAEIVDARASLALSSGTAAMHVALVAAGVGPGDEVITTPMTFASTVNVIDQVGAIPLLADVEPDTLNIDPSAVERVLTSETKAILPVHYAGHPVDLDPLLLMAEARDLFLIEDAAHAFPASYKGRPVGSGGNPVAFSFYATKNLTTAEGGMLTGDPTFLEVARIVSLHGMSRDAWKRYESGGSWRYDVVRPGFKYNMPDVLAAIGLAQLSKIDRFQQRRREVVSRYQDAFAPVASLELPIEREEVKHAWHLYVLRLRTEALTIDRDRFIDEMAKRNIGTSVHFIPIHFHSYYRDRYGWKPQDFPIASREFERIVSLPLSPALTDEDVDDVIEAVLDISKAFAR